MRRLSYLFIVIGLYLTTTGQSEPVRIAALKQRPPISARLAASKPPLPTFDEVHESFTAIVLNESGWKSVPDTIGIGNVILRHGGGRKHWRMYRGSGYGIDYLKFIRYAARVSSKVFPADSPWVQDALFWRYGKRGDKAREQHIRRQKKSSNAYWTSTLKKDCSEPAHWKQTHPGKSWLGYTKRCAALFDMTEKFLKGKLPNWCRTESGEPATPRWWGGTMDPPDPEWEELTCDEPDADCDEFDWREDPNNVSCARNSFYRLP
jgi:hypothetical protein